MATFIFRLIYHPVYGYGIVHTVNDYGYDRELTIYTSQDEKNHVFLESILLQRINNSKINTLSLRRLFELGLYKGIMSKEDIEIGENIDASKIEEFSFNEYSASCTIEKRKISILLNENNLIFKDFDNEVYNPYFYALLRHVFINSDFTKKIDSDVLGLLNKLEHVYDSNYPLIGMELIKLAKEDIDKVKPLFEDQGLFLNYYRSLLPLIASNEIKDKLKEVLSDEALKRYKKYWYDYHSKVLTPRRGIVINYQTVTNYYFNELYEILFDCLEFGVEKQLKNFYITAIKSKVFSEEQLIEKLNTCGDKDILDEAYKTIEDTSNKKKFFAKHLDHMSIDIDYDKFDSEELLYLLKESNKSVAKDLALKHYDLFFKNNQEDVLLQYFFDNSENFYASEWKSILIILKKYQDNEILLKLFSRFSREVAHYYERNYGYGEY